MQKKSSPLVTFIKKHKATSIILVIILVGLLWWSVANLTPRPLGDRLDYLGKEDSGGGLFYMDYTPYSVYYYGTDVTPEQLVNQFKDTSLKHPIEDNGQYIDVWLESHGETFSFTYKKEGNFKTTKKYILSILDEDYPKAKQYLK